MSNTALVTVLADLAQTDPHSTAGIDAIFSLAAQVVSEPEFEGQPLRVINLGRSAHTITPDAIAQKLLHVVREKIKTPADAIDWFRRFPSYETAVGGAVKALYGVRCEHQVALSDDIVLLPFSDLPVSRIRDWIIKEHRRANEARVLHGFTSFPGAALYRPLVMKPLFSPDGHDFARKEDWFEDLDTAELLLVLSGAVPSEAAHWMHFDDPDIALLADFGISRKAREFASAMQYRAEVNLTRDTTAGLLSAWRSIKAADDRSRLQLALERLLRSRAQAHPGNRAIDLAIALEVLFMNTDRDEHSYKISLRTARLLRSSVLDRRRAFLEVKRLYDMRSSMVHTGTIKSSVNIDGSAIDAAALVESVDRLCSEAIRKLIVLGSIPSDWKDAELA